MSGMNEIERLIATAELPELGPGPRGGVQAEVALNKALDELFRGVKLAAENQQLIRSLVLLWHDHLDAGHTIAQNIDGADGAFVHGIMHRREPDYGNAKYWFRRVGEHPAFPKIASRVTTLLETKGQSDLRDKLMPGGEWDAFAFVDCCEQAKRRSADESQKGLLREVQGIESRVLLERYWDEGLA